MNPEKDPPTPREELEARLTALLRECEALAQERGAAGSPELARLSAAYHEFCEALIRERSATAA